MKSDMKFKNNQGHIEGLRSIFKWHLCIKKMFNSIYCLDVYILPVSVTKSNALCLQVLNQDAHGAMKSPVVASFMGNPVFKFVL